MNGYAFKNKDGNWCLSILGPSARWKGGVRPANVYDTQQALIAEAARRNLTIVWEDAPT